MIFIRHRTAENNQRLLSHGFKNILVGDNYALCRPIASHRCFLVKAKVLRKCGEVRSHPPYPPGYATGGLWMCMGWKRSCLSAIPLVQCLWSIGGKKMIGLGLWGSLYYDIYKAKSSPSLCLSAVTK